MRGATRQKNVRQSAVRSQGALSSPVVQRPPVQAMAPQHSEFCVQSARRCGRRYRRLHAGDDVLDREQRRGVAAVVEDKMIFEDFNAVELRVLLGQARVVGEHQRIKRFDVDLRRFNRTSGRLFATQEEIGSEAESGESELRRSG